MNVSQIIGSRESQEDGYFKYEYKNYRIIGIIDGHGGNKAMNDIKENYTKYLATFLNLRKTTLLASNFDTLIKNFYIFLDKIYLAKKMESGCCISVVFHNKDNNKISIVQLGDTKVLIFDQNKNLIYQTIEHRLDNEDELNRIIKLEGSKNIRNVFGIIRYKSLMISRVLGDYNYKNLSLPRSKDPLSCIPDIVSLDIIDRLYCVLISDGIYDIINIDQISNCVKKQRFKDIHEYIMNQCNNSKRRKKDNCTIITYKAIIKALSC